MPFFRRIASLLIPLALAASPGFAMDLQSTTTPGRIPGVSKAPDGSTYGTPLTNGEIAINRADKNLFFKNVDGTIGRGALFDPSLPLPGQLTNKDGSGFMTILPSLNATARSIAQRMTDRINVLDFGGVDVTGATDSITGINNALNDPLRVIKKGAEVWFPCGRYLFASGTLASNGNSTGVFAGASSSCVNIMNGNFNAPAIKLGDGSDYKYDNSVSGFNIMGANGVVGAQGQTGITFVKQAHARIWDIKITRYPTALYNGISMEGVAQLFGDNIEIQDTLNDGWVCLDSTDMHVVNLRSDANGRYGHLSIGCAGNYFTNVTGFGNGQNAFAFLNGGTRIGHNENLFYTNLIGDTSGADNFYAEDLKTSHFTNAWASTQLDPTKNVFSAGFHLTSNKVFSNSFTNTSALLNNFAGILSDSPGDGTFPYSNTFNGVTLGAQDVFNGPAPGHGNGRGGSGGYGVYVAGGDMRITGGSSFGNTSAPAHVEPGALLEVRGVKGINNGPVAGVSPGPSPWTYTSGYTEETLCFSAASGVTSIYSGGAYLSSGGDRCIPLDPNRAIVVNYNSVPAVTVFRR